MTSEERSLPGYYPDPDDPTLERWWSNGKWGEMSRPLGWPLNKKTVGVGSTVSEPFQFKPLTFEPLTFDRVEIGAPVDGVATVDVTPEEVISDADTALDLTRLPSPSPTAVPSASSATDPTEVSAEYLSAEASAPVKPAKSKAGKVLLWGVGILAIWFFVIPITVSIIGVVLGATGNIQPSSVFPSALPSDATATPSAAPVAPPYDPLATPAELQAQAESELGQSGEVFVYPDLVGVGSTSEPMSLADAFSRYGDATERFALLTTGSVDYVSPSGDSSGNCIVAVTYNVLGGSEQSPLVVEKSMCDLFTVGDSLKLAYSMAIPSQVFLVDRVSAAN